MGVNWKGLLGGIAPVITKALTGGAPAAAAAALGVVGRALLGSEKATADEVAAAIAGATPEQLEKLRAAEQEFALKLVDTAMQLERIEADDRANARSREIAVRDRMPALLAWTLTVMVGLLIALLGFRVVPQENREPFLIVLGTVMAAWGAAMQYYHGSSSSSRTKDTVLGRLAGR